MKRLWVAIIIIMCILAGETPVLPAELSPYVDKAYQITSGWLRDNKLQITGGPNITPNYGLALMQGAIVVYGEGFAPENIRHPAQREAMAKRAAVVVAQRALAEYINGFSIAGDTLVNNGVLQFDLIRSTVDGFIKGAQVVVQEYSPAKDMAIALLKLGTRGPSGFVNVMYEKIFSDPKIQTAMIPEKPVYQPKPVTVQEDFDGLIVDATECNFRPALINRIFNAKGEVLYDPSKVSQKVLVEQGCGEYSNSTGKAKAALETRGTKNPLVVKAAGTVNPSDLLVSDDDAIKIFSANQKVNFLASAKVAFVLK